MQRSGLFSVFEAPRHFLYVLAMAAVPFSAYYFVMVRLPGHANEACVMGASLTPLNIAFSAVLSVLTGVMLLGAIRLYQERAKGRFLTSGTLGLGFVLGFFTVFCALCTLPVISVFGLAVGLGFFTTYELWFKGVSLLLMGFGLWLLHRQLKGCERCVS